MDQPIFNPPNPYVGTLRVFPGTLVRVAGRPRPNATRFAINFQAGPSLNPRDDLALHLSPCFAPPPRIIRNSLQNGVWGIEESWSQGPMLMPAQPFEIMILVEQNQFNIAINGVHFCEFRHRLPHETISHLTIDGDVDIDRITISSQQSYAPPPQPSYQPNAPYPTGQGGSAMPMPSAYPVLPPGGPKPASGYYPSASQLPQPSMPGPMPAGGSYNYPQTSYPQQPSYYPSAGPGPSPAAGGYPGGHHQGTGQTSTPFGSLPIGGKTLGTLAGLGLGAAAGAAVLSAVNPLKVLKKPKKLFKTKGFGRSSSSSSNSSFGSFSSNSS